MNSGLRKRIWLGVSLGLLLSGCGRTSNETHSAAENAGQKETRIVKTSADVIKIGELASTLGAGTSAEISIPISIEQGYHINANPATFVYLIATELTADKSDGITFGKPIYPRAEKRKFQFAEQPLAVYEGQVQIKLPLQAAPNAAKGTRPLALHLRIQACDEEKCFPPATLQAIASLDLK